MSIVGCKIGAVVTGTGNDVTSLTYVMSVQCCRLTNSQFLTQGLQNSPETLDFNLVKIEPPKADDFHWILLVI